MLCRRYTAEQALQMGLINAVVPPESLTRKSSFFGALEIAALEPDGDCDRQEVVQSGSESIRGISAMGMQALTLFYQTE